MAPTAQQSVCLGFIDHKAAGSGRMRPGEPGSRLRADSSSRPPLPGSVHPTPPRSHAGGRAGGAQGHCSVGVGRSVCLPDLVVGAWSLSLGGSVAGAWSLFVRVPAAGAWALSMGGGIRVSEAWV